MTGCLSKSAGVFGSSGLLSSFQDGGIGSQLSVVVFEYSPVKDWARVSGHDRAMGNSVLGPRLAIAADIAASLMFWAQIYAFPIASQDPVSDSMWGRFVQAGI